MDPLDLPVDRLCNLVYFWLVDGLSERRKAEVDRALEQPPVGVARPAVPSGDDDAWSPKAEMDAFAQAQRATAGVTG